MHYFKNDLVRNIKKRKNQLVVGGLWIAFLLSSLIFLYSPIFRGEVDNRLPISSAYQSLILSFFVFLIPIFAMYFYFLFTEEERKDDIYARIVECGVKRSQIQISKLLETLVLSICILGVAILMFYLLAGSYTGFDTVLNLEMQAFLIYTGIAIILAYLMIEVSILFSILLKSDKASIFASFAVYFITGGFFHVLYRLTRFDIFYLIKNNAPFALSQALFTSFQDTLFKISNLHALDFTTLSTFKNGFIATFIVAIVLTILNQQLMKNAKLK